MASLLGIDDEGSMRQLVRLVLETAGHQVREAPNGRGELARNADKATDFVITASGRPERNGLEWANRWGACETLSKPSSLDN